ncbi:MAG: GNAT family N-acetyltransferase [Gracilimonas sp.]|nr:GNAT family N-acetyltransferase [Gracilimonas sp.]
MLDASKLDEEIEILIEMHQNRWNQLGYPGAFFDQRFEPFVKEFAKKALEKNQLWFKIAVDKSGHCATRLAFKYKGKYYDYLTSFDYDAPSSKYRPGIGLLTIMIKDAFTDNGNSIELLRGDEAYKFDLTQTVHKNWNWKVSFGRERNRLISGLTATVSLLTFTVLKEITLFQVQQNLHNSLKAIVVYPKVRYQMLKYKYQDD